MRVKNFFNDEFKLFSIADNVRSIPSVIDGFKPSQRKCIFGLIKRGENAEEIKVAQLGAYIAQVSDYHHGEGSLSQAIVGLAQNYTGSNNLNYLKPNGQFGSRLSPEASAPRYIFTEFSDSFRKVFKKADDIILKHLDSDGQKIEPDYYIPIIPSVLINGSRGMGTGFATMVLNYNPEELRQNILNILNGKDPAPLVPWYKGFKGKIYRNGAQTINEGVYEVVNTTTLKITELPIGVYLDDYKEHLYKLQDAGLIKDFDSDSTEEGFVFTINIPRATGYMTHEDIMTKFKLVSRDTENLTLWTEKGRLKVFSDVQAIVDYFVEFRLSKYEERRVKLLEMNHQELTWLTEKLRFIRYYIANSELFSKKGKKELKELLEKNEFVEISKLLDIRIYNLTKDEIEALEKDIKTIETEIKKLNKTNNVEMYINELNELKI